MASVCACGTETGKSSFSRCLSARVAFCALCDASAARSIILCRIKKKTGVDGNLQNQSFENRLVVSFRFSLTVHPAFA